MLYKPSRFEVPEKFNERIKLALNQGGKVSIKLNVRKDDDGNQQQVLLLTNGQLKKIEDAREKGKKYLTIRFSRRQVEANMKYEGGFLGMLAALAASALPAILACVATGAVTGAVEKAVSGNGLYIQKQGQCARIQPVKGGGLYLAPYPNSPTVNGDGLYLKHGGDIYGQKILSESPWMKDELPILNIIL